MPDSDAGTGSLHRVHQFDLYSLGVVHDANMSSFRGRKMDPNIQVVNKAEEAQLEGKVKLVAREEDRVTLAISKHGLKIITPCHDNNNINNDLVQRFPLREVSLVVQYEDSFGRPHIAIKVGHLDRNLCDIFVYQCLNHDQAENICRCVRRVFDLISHGAV